MAACRTCNSFRPTSWPNGVYRLVVPWLDGVVTDAPVPLLLVRCIPPLHLLQQTHTNRLWYNGHMRLTGLVLVHATVHAGRVIRDRCRPWKSVSSLSVRNGGAPLGPLLPLPAEGRTPCLLPELSRERVACSRDTRDTRSQTVTRASGMSR